MTVAVSAEPSLPSAYFPIFGVFSRLTFGLFSHRALYGTLATATFAKKDHSKTLHWANQTIALNPDYWVPYAILAAMFAENGDLEAAKQSASSLRRAWPAAFIRARGGNLVGALCAARTSQEPVKEPFGGFKEKFEDWDPDD